jgi:hypothetical protein
MAVRAVPAAIPAFHFPFKPKERTRVWGLESGPLPAGSLGQLADNQRKKWKGD